MVLLGERKLGERQLTGQTYMKLRSLDLDDTLAILDFADTYGRLGVERMPDDRFDWLPPHLHPGKGDRWPEWANRHFKDTPLEREVFHRRREAISQWFDREMSAEEMPAEEFHWLGAGEPIEEFRFAASCLILLTDAWLFHLGVISNEQVHRWFPLVFLSHEGSRGRFSEKIDDLHAVEILTRGLTAALRSFSPQVLSPADFWPPTPDMPTRGKSGVTGWPRLKQPRQCLYELLALELFNDIARGASYRECAADDCSEIFTIQENRNDVGFHRSTAIYHEPRCKNRQLQRRKRERDRREKATQSQQRQS